MIRLVCFVLVLFLLSGCLGRQAVSFHVSEEHGHVSAVQGNLVVHEEVGYCGNTQTTLRKIDGNRVMWQTSFMYGDSVALTDLLRWLDYRDSVCRCLPEYQVDTEFGSVYGINLSEGYVRYGDGQVQLTEGQLERVRDIIHANTPLYS